MAKELAQMKLDCGMNYALGIIELHYILNIKFKLKYHKT